MRKAVVTLLTLAFLSSSLLFYGGRTIPVALAEDSEFDPTTLCPVGALALVGTLSNGAEWLICRPPPFLRNGDAIVFSHGTVSALNPSNAGRLEAIEGQLNLDGATIPQLVNGLGFDFAVSARSKVGLSVLEGIAELNELIGVLPDPPINIFLVGVSQGG